MKKVFIYLTLLLVVVSMTSIGVGCKSTKTTTEEAEAVEAVPEKVTEEEVKKEQVVLEIWDSEEREPAKIAWDYLLGEFKKEYPHITVEVSAVSWGDMFTKVEAGLKTNTLPDILMSWGSLPPQFARMGAIQSITDVIQDIGEDQFPASAMKYYKYNDENIAMPIAIYTDVLFYRSDIYEDLGLEPPTTWDEVLENSKAIMENTDMYGIGLYMAAHEADIFYGLMGANNGAIVGQDGESITINSPEAVEVLEYLKELFKYSSTDMLVKSAGDVRVLVTEGNVAQILTSTSFCANILSLEDTSMKFSAVTFPTNKGDKGTMFNPVTYEITSTTEHLEEAKLLFKFMRRDDIALEFHKLYIPGHVPAIKSVNENEEFWNSPNVKDIVGIIQAGVTANEKAILAAQELGPNSVAGVIMGTGVVGSMVQKVLLDGMDPQEALEWCEQELTEALK